jgi:3-phenylpropionate/cinnamic acid dioxygenase small subunit
MEPNRRREDIRMLHIPSWGAIVANGERYSVTSKFAVYETKAIDGISRLAYVGCYNDEIAREGSWKIHARNVVLDTFTFKSMVIPI